MIIGQYFKDDEIDESPDDEDGKSVVVNRNLMCMLHHPDSVNADEVDRLSEPVNRFTMV